MRDAVTLRPFVGEELPLEIALRTFRRAERVQHAIEVEQKHGPTHRHTISPPLADDRKEWEPDDGNTNGTGVVPAAHKLLRSPAVAGKGCVP
ncbi:hypothetical protein KRMM14A1259_15570 [Krasilnikovia sp. MM14-A1259]